MRPCRSPICSVVRSTAWHRFLTGGRVWPAALVAVLVCCAPVLAADTVAESHTLLQKSAPVDGRPLDRPLEALMFYLFAAVTLGSALAMCISRNIVRMAVHLFIALGAVAALYFLLLANFIAVIQLIVYAGGTLILLVFGVMLTSKSPWVRFEVKRSEIVAAVLVCTLLAVGLLGAVLTTVWPGQTDGTVAGPSMATIGRELLTTYLVPFEVVSVLLLVVMIGAAYLARQEK